jgi:hypothetical protein
LILLKNNNLNVSIFQIFNKNQLEEYSRNLSSSFTDHCFVNCLKYYKASEDIINYAKDIILDVLLLKDMNKLCTVFGIVVNISFVDEYGHCHIPKKYTIKNKV